MSNHIGHVTPCPATPYGTTGKAWRRRSLLFLSLIPRYTNEISHWITLARLIKFGRVSSRCLTTCKNSHIRIPYTSHNRNPITISIHTLFIYNSYHITLLHCLYTCKSRYTYTHEIQYNIQSTTCNLLTWSYPIPMPLRYSDTYASHKTGDALSFTLSGV